jgi:hypothetical protein
MLSARDHSHDISLRATAAPRQRRAVQAWRIWAAAAATASGIITERRVVTHSLAHSANEEMQRKCCVIIGGFGVVCARSFLVFVWLVTGPVGTP